MDDPDKDAEPDTGEHDDADESENPELNPLPDPPPEKEEVGVQEEDK